MSGTAALTGLTALLALAGCFQLSVESCSLRCTSDEGCPGDLKCLGSATGQGLCASPGVKMCANASDGGTDAGVDRMDTGGTDAEAGASGPPSMLCHNGTCLTLPVDVRSNLVLLLWPSNLPATIGSPVSVWADQSGQGNDAHALSTTGLPKVIPDGVQLDSAQQGTGFVVADSPSLDFGAGDFAVIVVAGLSSSTTAVTLFRKSDEARTNSRQIAIDWILSSTIGGRPQGTVDDTAIPATMDIPQPSVEAYGLYRSTDHVELHLNGIVLGSADLPTPGLTTSNPENLYLGVGSMFGSPADSIEAVIAIRGPVGSSELNQLEVFLGSLFMQSPP